MRRGFTLLEVIISLALTALTMGVLVSLFSTGMRLWQRSECGVRHDQAVYAAFEGLRRDLHGIQPFKPFPFKGGYDAIEFAVMTDSPEFGAPAQEPGRKRIYFDKKNRMLCESVLPFRGMKRMRESCSAVLENIESVKFDYLNYNFKTQAANWSPQWRGNGLPVSVRMEVEYEDVCREQKTKKQFTIAIPVGPVR